MLSEELNNLQDVYDASTPGQWFTGENTVKWNTGYINQPFKPCQLCVDSKTNVNTLYTQGFTEVRDNRFIYHVHTLKQYDYSRCEIMSDGQDKCVLTFDQQDGPEAKPADLIAMVEARNALPKLIAYIRELEDRLKV